MNVSVIVPAHNAAVTLAETLESLLAQSFGRWHAIVVDDGSDDDTASLAADFAARDGRIAWIGQPAQGVSAARNVGLRCCPHEWLLFLDADDVISPRHLEVLTERLADDSSMDAVHCGWARLMPDGTVIAQRTGHQSEDLFPELTNHCVFPIHACVVRRAYVEAVGGFDPTLRTCEDFDLWQRIARSGARFCSVPDVLALYRMRADSASLDGRRLLDDGLRVIARGHSPDHRVCARTARHADGMPEGDRPVKEFLFAAWCAGLVIGRGDDARPLLRALPRQAAPALAAEHVARNIFETVPLARCLTPSDWIELWPEVGPHVEQFLGALEEHSMTRGLQHEARSILEAAVLEHGCASAPITVGKTYSVWIDAGKPIADVSVPAGIERINCVVSFAGERLGALWLPAFEGVVSSYVLKDAIAAEYAWPILRYFFQRALTPCLQLRSHESGTSIWRGPVCLATAGGTDQSIYSPEVHAQGGWTLFLQELWNRSDWTLDRFYNPNLPDVPGEIVHAVDGWVVVEVSKPLPVVAATGSDVSVLVQVGGTPIGSVSVRPEEDVLSPSALRSRITQETGFELCRAAVREGLLGRSGSEPRSLQARLADAANGAARCEQQTSLPHVGPHIVPAPGWTHIAAEALRPACDGALIARRGVGQIDSAISRRAELPVQLLAELSSAAAIGGEPVLQIPERSRPVGRLTYRPELVWRVRSTPSTSSSHDRSPNPPLRQAKREHGRGVFENVFARRADPWNYTSPYEEKKYDQTLALLPSNRIARALEIGCAEGHFTERLAPRVDSLIAADISLIALRRAAERCTNRTNVQFVSLDLRTDPLPGRFDLLVCSEFLYYMGDREQLAVVVRKLVEALEPNGYLLHAHAHLVVDDPDSCGFDWAHPFGAKVIGEVLAETAPLRLVKELRTPLYRIQLFEKGTAGDAPEVTELTHQPAPLLPEVERHVRWRGGTPRRRDTVSDYHTASLPIVMYHRVAAPNADGLDRYLVTPEAFETQLAYLKDCGYYSISLNCWREAMARHDPLPGRAIILTFDDGYRDFITHSWPLLKRYGFSALVFLVADEIGGSNRWDEMYGEPVSLLDWDEIRRLQVEGVEFGSHSASHPRLTGLAPAEVVRELTRSRTILSSGLGIPIDTVAYPYGAVDTIVRHLTAACGFTFGVTCHQRRAGLWEAPLALPRIEVRGDETFADFVRNLGE